MLKIKVFDEQHEKELEEDINLFIDKISKENKEVVDIKFSTSHISDYANREQIYCFSALVMYDDKVSQEYKPKKYEIVEKVSD